MTRTNVLAAILYRTAVNLKRQGESQLKGKKKQEEMRNHLWAMQFLTSCLGKKKISCSEANCILSTLRDLYRFDISDTIQPLLDASEESDYSPGYEDLLFQMQYVLSACICELFQKKKGYSDRVCRYLMGFHNYPRAFLALNDRAHISAEDAAEYSKTYMKFDDRFSR